MKLSHGIINYLKLKETSKQEISKIKNTKKNIKEQGWIRMENINTDYKRRT